MVAQSVIGGPFYTGTSYPAEYQGRYFLGDYLIGWIGMVEVDAAYSVLSFSQFHTGAGGLVDITAHPVTGDLYFTRIFTERVMRIRFDDPATDAPIASADASGIEIRPNPFRRSASIHFDVPVSADVSIGVWDVGGRKVRGFATRLLPAGRHSQAWDGRDDEGGTLAAGVYFVRLEVGERSITRKVVRVD
jgi:hypothetical protein